MNAITTDRLLNFSEGARCLGISLRQFRRLVDDGRLPFVRVSERAPRVRASEVDAYISAATVRRSDEKKL